MDALELDLSRALLEIVAGTQKADGAGNQLPVKSLVRRVLIITKLGI
jgi:hypothetical protein